MTGNGLQTTLGEASLHTTIKLMIMVTITSISIHRVLTACQVPHEALHIDYFTYSLRDPRRVYLFISTLQMQEA